MLSPRFTRVGESLPSFLLRLLTHTPAFVTYHHGAAKNYYVNIFNWPVPLAQRMIRGLLVGIGVIGLIWMRRRLPTLKSRRYIFELGAVAAFLLWAESWCWVPHYVTLIFTLMAAGLIADDAEAKPTARIRMIILLAAGAILMAMTSDVVKIFGPHASNYSRTLDPVLFAGVLLVLGIMTAGYAWSVAVGKQAAGAGN